MQRKNALNRDESKRKFAADFVKLIENEGGNFMMPFISLGMPVNLARMNTKNPWISIHIAISKKEISIVIGNSRNNLKKNNHDKQKKGGLGLVRLQERLKMLYPKQQKDLLIINENSADAFFVHLKIPLL